MKRYYAYDKSRHEWLTHGTYGWGDKSPRHPASWDNEAAIKAIVTRKLYYLSHLKPLPRREDLVIVCIDIEPMLRDALRAAEIGGLIS